VDPGCESAGRTRDLTDEDMRVCRATLLGSLCLGLSLGCRAPDGSESQETELTVTSARAIIDDIARFDHEEVTLEGRFTTDAPHMDTDVHCEPVPREEIVFSDTYMPYPTAWGLLDDDVFVGVRVQTREGTLSGTRPTFEEGEEIRLTGRVVASNWIPACSRRGFRSFFLLVVDEVGETRPRSQESRSNRTAPG
jgi:hypothetical protein